MKEKQKVTNMSKKDLDNQGDGGGKTVQCPICGAENAKGAAECTECSFTFEVEQPADSITCAECGAELPAGTDSCFICGAEVKPVATTPAETGSDDWDLGVVGGDSIPAEDISEEPEPAVADIEIQPELGENQFPCPSCGKPVDVGTSKCKNCWTDLPEMFSCPKCQNIIAKDSTSCPECYAKLKNGILMEGKTPVPAPVVVEAEEPLEELMPMEETEEVIEETTEVFESPQVFGIECPFCQSITNPSEDICPECGMPLIEEEKKDKQPTITRKKEEPDWYRMIAIGVVIILLVSGILPFALPLPHVDRVQIRIDGAFGDWDRVTGQNDTAIAELPSSVDIVSYKLLTDAFNLYAFYELRGTAFGDSNGDTARVFLDIDQNQDTGYSIMGIGADYQIRVFGHNGIIDSSSCLRFDNSRPSNDFNGFETSSPSVPHTAQSAQDANKFEVRVSLDDLMITPAQPVTAVFYMADSEGNWDHSDTPLASQGSVLMVKQSSLVPVSGLLQGASAQALSLELRVVGRPVTIAGITVPDCAVPQYATSMASGSTQYVNLTTNAATPAAGALIHREAAASNFDVENTHVVVLGQGAYAYARSAPATIAIDGAFADWVGKGLQLDDASDDQKAKNAIDSIDDPGLDMLSQTTQLENNRLNILVETAGDIFAGMWVPELEESYVDTTPTQTRTSDEQDHTYSEPPVTSTRQSTAIQRPTEKPEKTGEGKIRVFIDTGAGNAGYLIKGINADYLVEVMGQDGKATRTLMYRYDGTDQNMESWMQITANPHGASSGSRVELAVPLSSFNSVANNASAVIQLVDWNMNGDVADISAWDVFQIGDRFGTRGQSLPDPQFLPGTVRGSVKDASNNIVEGVTVVLRDTSNRFTTDVTNYLEYNYMISQEISAGQTVFLYSNDGLNYGTGTTVMPSGTATNRCNLSLATPLPATAPVNLEAKMFSTGVRLTWETGAAPNSFNIFRTYNTTSQGGNSGVGRYYGVKMATVDGTVKEYLDNKAIDNLTYYYFIQSVTGSEFHYSGEVSILVDYQAAPQIQHDTFNSYYASYVPIKATITDDVGVVSAAVYYRKGTAGAWSESTMDMASGNGQNGDWQAWIPVDAVDYTTYQYYIEAEDGSNVGLFGGPGYPGYPSPLNFTAKTGDDPYPVYGYVKWGDGSLVGSGVQVYIEWTNRSGPWASTVLHDPSFFPAITDANSQYTIDIMDYDQDSIIWGNATIGGIWGYNVTGNAISANGGQMFNITLNTPIINISKSAPATAAPSQNIVYTITVTNTGNSTAYNINVTESYPPAWVIVGASVPPATFSNNVWIIPSLNPGATFIITINVQIDALAPFNTTVFNNVSATWTNYTGAQWGIVNATASTLITGGIADLEIAKSGPATANTGQTITYTITVWNNGTLGAHNVWVNDTFLGISVNVGIIAADSSWTNNFNYLVPVGATGWIFNNATVQYTNGLIQMPEERDGHAVRIVDPLLEILKSGPATANTGQTITYAITVWNNGTSDAHNVWVNDTFLGISVNVGVIAAGDSWSGNFNYLVPVGASGWIFNNATATYGNSFIAIPTVTDGHAVHIVNPSLEISKTGPARAMAGQTITYTITIWNNGTSAAQNVWVNDTFLGVNMNVGNIPSSDVVILNFAYSIPVGTTGWVYNNATAAYGNGFITFPTVTDGHAVEIVDIVLVIQKTGPTTANTGQTITYTITVWNNGTSDAHNVWVNDTFLGISVNVGIIAAGSSWTNNFNYLIPVGATGWIFNNATVQYTNGFTQMPEEMDGHAVRIVNPSLDISKTGPTRAMAGQTITYTITVWNNGTSDAHNVWVNDTFLGISANVGVIAAGSSWTGNFNYNIPIGASGWIFNNATVNYTNGFIQMPEDRDGHAVEIVDLVLVIQKTGPTTANTGQIITYTITVWNNGTSDAHNVWVNDTFLGISVNVGIIAAGSSWTNNFNYLVPVGATGWIYNNATVQYTNGFIQMPEEMDGHAVRIVNPTLEMSKTGPGTANTGQIITYTITVWNNGTSDAYNVWVNDTFLGISVNVGVIAAGSSWTGNYNYLVPVGTTGWIFNNGTATYGNGFIAFPTITDGHAVHIINPHLVIQKSGPATATPGQTITYTITVWNNGTSAAQNVWVNDAFLGISVNVGVIAAGSFWSGNFIYNIPIGASGWIFNNATLNYTNSFIQMPEEMDGHAVRIVNPSLDISKTGPARAMAGQTITYTITVWNNGTSDAHNVWVNDTFLGISVNVGVIAAGSSWTGNFNYNIPIGANGWLFNNATVQYTNGFIQMPEDRDGHAVEIVDLVLVIQKTGPTTANTGQTITYTITVWNNGTSDAHNVWVNDTFLGISVNVGIIAAGSFWTNNFNYLVPVGATGWIFNNATVQYTNGFTQMPEEMDGHAVRIVNPSLDISKTGPARAMAGQTITYTITVWNNGTSDAHNVWVNDTFLGISVNVGVIAAGSSWTGNFNYNIPIGANGWLFNNATVAYGNGFITFPSVTDGHAVEIVNLVLVIQKTGPTTANTGQTIMYTITVWNNGTSAAQNVWVNDTFLGISVNVGVIAAGSSWTNNYNYMVPVGATGWLFNNATVHYTNGFIKMPEERDGHAVRIVDPLLTILKSGPATANTGQIITYTITVWNNGTSDAQDVWVVDSFLGISVNVPMIVAGGSWTNNYNYLVPTGTTGWIFNNATAAYRNGFIAFGPVTDGHSVQIIDPVIEISKTGPPTANTGQTITYTITVWNNGTSDAHNVWVNDTLLGISVNVPVIVAGGSWTNNYNYLIPVGATGWIFNNATVNYTNGFIQMPEDRDGHLVRIVNPSLEISKTGPARAMPGQSITYTITVWNNGTSDAENVWVNDPFLGINSFVGTIVAGNSWTGNFNYNIPIGASGWIFNNATVAYENGFVAFPPVTDGHAVEIVDFVLVIQKTGPTTANTGQTITYTITVWNNGTSDAHNVWVNDTFLGISVNVGTIMAGSSWTNNFNYLVPFVAIGWIFNNATVQYTNGFIQMPEERDGHAVQIVNPWLEISKSGPATANTGQTITYTITAWNNGTSDAQNVWVNDTFLGINVNVGVIAAGGSWTNNYNYLVPVGAAGWLFNNATVSYGNGFYAFYPVTNCHAVWLVDPSLELTKTGPSRAMAGQIITYTITVWNNGTSDAQNVWVNDTFLGISVNVGTIVAGSSWTNNFNYNIPIAATGWIFNNATVNYTNGFIQMPEDRDVHAVEIVDLVLFIQKTGPATANTGQTITYTITVWNNGTSDAQNVWVNDTFLGISVNVGTIVAGSSWTNNFNYLVPVGTTEWIFNNATLHYTNGFIQMPEERDGHVVRIIDPLLVIQKTGPTTAVAGQTITYTVTVWNNGTSDARNVWVSDPLLGINIFVGVIAAGSFWTDNFNYNVPAGATGWIFNNATATYGNGFRAFTPVINGHAVRIIFPSLEISKTGPARAMAGQTITYTIAVWNNGTFPAQNVWISDSFLGIDLFVGSIPVGGSWSGNFNYNIPIGATGWLHNNATATYGNGFIPFNPVRDSHAVEIVDLLLVIQKTGPATASSGQIISYTITVWNNASTDAFNVWVNDTFLGISVNVGTIVAGSSWTNNFNYNVPAAATGWIYNNATVHYTNGFIQMPEERDGHAVQIIDPILVIQKTGPVTANTGQIITYSIIVWNNGTSDAQNVWVNDPFLGINIFVGVIVAGNSWTGNFNYQIPIGASGWIFNNATATYGNGFRAFQPVIDGHALHILDPSFEISKMGPARAMAGQTITYTITVWNNGTFQAQNVWITDLFLGINIFIGTISMGSSWTGNFNYNIPVGTTGWLYNNATATYGNGFIAFPAVTDGHSVEIVDFVLVIQKTGPATANTGQTITYTITVWNNGTSDAQNVWVNDTFLGISVNVGTIVAGSSWTNNYNYLVPVGTTGWIFNNATVNYTNGFIQMPEERDGHAVHIVEPLLIILKTGPATVNTGQTIIYTITLWNNGTSAAQNVWVSDTFLGINVFVGVIAAGGSWSNNFNYLVPVGATGWIFNNATATYGNGFLAFPAVTDGHMVQIVNPSLEISKTGPARAMPGQTITYTITVWNNGTSVAQNVWVSDPFLGVNIFVGTIAPGTSWTGNYNFLIPVGFTGWIFNNATATYGNGFIAFPTVTDGHSVEIVDLVLVIQKTGPATANTGETITYTITVWNNGTSDARNVWVNDTEIGISIYLANLLAGRSFTGDFNHIVPVGATGWIYNNATLHYTNGFVRMPEERDGHAVRIVDPLLTIRKVGPATANTGQMITYTISVWNNGTSAARDVWVSDIFLGINIFVGMIAAGDSWTANYNYLVPIGTTGWIYNNATTNYGNGFIAFGPVTDGHSVQIIDPAIEISKTGPATANTGQTITYTITVWNNGTSDAHNVWVNDTFLGISVNVGTIVASGSWTNNYNYLVPVGATGWIFNNATVAYGNVFIAFNPVIDGHAILVVAPSLEMSKTGPATANTGQTIMYTITVWNNGTSPAHNVWVNDTFLDINVFVGMIAASGSWTANYNYLVPVGATGWIFNNATVAYGNGFIAFNPVIDGHAILVVTPSLEMSKSGPSSANTGQNITYTITVWNNGTANAVNVVVIDPLLGINWNIGTLPYGESRTSTFTFMVPLTATGSITNTATVTFNNGYAPSQTLSDSHTVQIIDPQLIVTKAAPANATSGEVIAYNITITNTGNSIAYNVWLNETFPANVSYVNSSIAPSSSANNSWYNASIGPGETWTIVIWVQVMGHALGNLTNNVAVNYTNGFRNMPSVYAVNTTVVTGFLQLNISKTANATAQAGSMIQYVITIRNTGTLNATNIVLTEAYPSGVIFQSASPSPTSGNNVWSLGNLAPGQNITITIWVRVANNTGSGWQNNTVLLAYSGPTGTPAANITAAASTRITAPMMVITKTGPTLVNTGDIFQYTITYTNNGDGIAYNVLIVETYPAGVSFVSAFPGATSGGNIWEIGQILPGASGTILITVRLTNYYGVPLRNSAELTYESIAGVRFPAIQSVAFTNVTVLPGMPLVTSTPPAFVWAGDTFTLYANVMGIGAEIDTVILYFTDIFGNQWSSEMIPYWTTSNGSGIYQLVLPGQSYKGFVSYFVWVNDTNGNEARTGFYDVPVRLPPYIVWGTIFSHRGLTVGGSMVLITNSQTNETVIAYADGAGRYMMDLATLYSGYMDGEYFTVFATDGTFYGSNQSFIDITLYSDTSMENPNRQVNVVMNEIPEFTTILIPVLGMLVLVALLGRRRRKKVDAEAI
jgi:uncharacterized repeat protein (TIGR01451 family)